MIRIFTFFFQLSKAISYGWLMLLLAGCKDGSRHKAIQKVKDDTLTGMAIEGDLPVADNGDPMLSTIYRLNTIGGELVRVAASERSEHNPFFLSGDANYIVAIKYLDNQVIKADTLLSNEFTYTEIDSAQIIQETSGNNTYLLLAVREAFKGQAIIEQTVNFILVDINSLEHYVLLYEGVPSVRCHDCIDGSFVSNPSLDKNPALKKILYGYANKSKWVYRPASQAEKDARHAINYEQKWYADNHADNQLANGHASVPQVIYSTYYQDDLLKLTAKQGGTFTTIENERFLIASFFRGNILGFDKQKQLYFPVFIESCITGCDKKIKFNKDNILDILYDEYSTNENYTIDLDKIQFN